MSAPMMPAAIAPGALGLSVLVLNRSFVAVHITNVRRAITLLFPSASLSLRKNLASCSLNNGLIAKHPLILVREL